MDESQYFEPGKAEHIVRREDVCYVLPNLSYVRVGDKISPPICVCSTRGVGRVSG